MEQVLESEVLYDLLNAIHEHKYVSLKTSRNRIKVLPFADFVILKLHNFTSMFVKIYNFPCSIW